MTRFARAKGSKASNERVPEDATSWVDMKEQLERKRQEEEETKKRREVEEKRRANYRAFVEEAEKEELENSKWAEFPEENNSEAVTHVKVNKNKSRSEKKNEDKNMKGEIINEKRSKGIKGNKIKKECGSKIENSEIGNKKKKDKTQNENVIDGIKNKKKKTKEGSENKEGNVIEKDDVEFNKLILKLDEILEEIDLKNEDENCIIGDLNEEIPSENKGIKRKKINDCESVQLKNKKPKKEIKTSKVKEPTGKNVKNKKTKKKKNVEVKKPLEELTEEELRKVNKKKEKKLKQLEKRKLFKKQKLESQSNTKDENSVSSQTNSEQNYEKTVQKKSFTKKPFESKSLKSSTTFPKKKKKLEEYKRRKPDNRPEKMMINGNEVHISYYDGFPIKKEDYDRLQKLRKEMISRGLPRSEINIAMKLERRKAEKALAREKKKVCFNCRKSGHILSECLELGENRQEAIASGICFKCGSTEHTHFECKVVRGQEFKFAQCFICKEQGHIARQCPDNNRGLYPKGGACKMCGDVTHLKKDCPKYQVVQEEKTIALETIGDNVEGLEKGSKFVEEKRRMNKIIKF